MPHCHMWSETKEIPRSIVKKCAEFGILGAACGHVPEEYLPFGLPAGIKPSEWDAFHEMIVIDELARCGSGGLLWGLQGVCCRACQSGMGYVLQSSHLFNFLSINVTGFVHWSASSPFIRVQAPSG